MKKMGKAFMVFWLFGLFMFLFGFDLLPKQYFHITFALLGLGFIAFWLYGLFVVPPAISEQMTKSHHPDPDVRALQDGEITITEYARRKADKASDA